MARHAFAIDHSEIIRTVMCTALGPDLTITQAAAWRDTLVDALRSGPGDLVLDLSAVTDVDSAGLQLLLATRRSLRERGATLQLKGPSATVLDALAVFGLDARLDAIDREVS